MGKSTITINKKDLATCQGNGRLGKTSDGQNLSNKIEIFRK